MTAHPGATPAAPPLPARFALGRTFITPAALAVLQQTRVSASALLQRHVAGDWGSVCAEDAATNESALTYGSRLLSVYWLAMGKITSREAERLFKVWVITEADRSVTTILLPEDY